MPEEGSPEQPGRRVQELALLFELSQRLAFSVDLREVVKPFLETLAEHMGLERATLTLLNRETGDIYIQEAHGLSEAQMKRGRYRLGEGITGRVVASGEPAVIPRISEEPEFLDRTGARRRLRRQDVSFVCVPVKLGNQVIGALSADRPCEEEASLQDDVRLLSIIASMIAQAVRLRQSVEEERRRLLAENVRLQHELEDRFQPSNIVGSSHEMRAVYDLIEKVSATDTTVLIRGESGTGKELVAHAIHYNSPRAAKPFVRVHCAALPETVIESELFGHEKGAFTGAVQQRKGRFELADRGTIFLDEIGDLTASTQIKLLRVLQEREFERVGGTDPVRVDVRVIAATHRDLEDLIEKERFRSDLYYRLNVFPIHVPSLRERRTDIPLLVDHFIEKYGERAEKGVQRVSGPALDALMSHEWPGNVRELENCIERAVLMTPDETIRVDHLPPTVQACLPAAQSVELEIREGRAGTLPAVLEALERRMIVKALESTNGNMAAAARELGITERVIGLRVEKYGLDPQVYRNSP